MNCPTCKSNNVLLNAYKSPEGWWGISLKISIKNYWLQYEQGLTMTDRAMREAFEKHFLKEGHDHKFINGKYDDKIIHRLTIASKSCSNNQILNYFPAFLYEFLACMCLAFSPPHP